MLVSHKQAKAERLHIREALKAGMKPGDERFQRWGIGSKRNVRRVVAHLERKAS